MALWARIEDNKVIETTPFNPTNFNNSITFIEVPVNLEQYADSNYVVVAGEVQPPSFDYLKAQLMKLVEEWRWKNQINGTVVHNSFNYGTRDEDRASYGQAVQLAQTYEALNPGETFTTPWKSKNGFVNLGLTDLITISMLVGQHITQCFGQEATVGGAIQDAIDGNVEVVANMLEAFYTLTELPIPEEIIDETASEIPEAPVESEIPEPIPSQEDNLQTPVEEIAPFDPEANLPSLPEIPNED